MKAIFTIVSRNYLGLARVLGESLRIVEPEVHFYVFTADTVDVAVRNEYPFTIIETKDTVIKDPLLWKECAFKYNVTEFCTFLKPYAFEYLFSVLNVADAIYLDPDIFAFSSFSDVWTALETKSIVVTPHIMQLKKEYDGAIEEGQFLNYGIYNLGFLALKRNPEVMTYLTWWALRLNRFCYDSSREGYFTDQKWANFIPVFFNESYFLLNHLGSDVAPWNFHEREIVKTTTGYKVKLRTGNSSEQDLIFVHFSGLDFKSIDLSNLSYKDAGISYHDDIIQLIRFYKEKLDEFSFNQYFSLGYEHKYFDNGTVIINFYRRLYSGYLKKYGQGWKDPFSTADGSFYNLLKQKGLLSKQNTSNVAAPVLNQQGRQDKKKKIEILFRLLKKVLGFDRFILLMEYLNNNTEPEKLVYLLENDSQKRTND
ncbi:hypothetical protein [Chitinophaga tropicalis]|uniref:Glycosyl transferase n=1 Tax=Chitinophaga tropicalis TaxID=2683588 RepID=A0A7K1TZ98_9BACT|nr:hypothetical protein [Chitinophaga tropicalis]MVT07441.1 hypothetical protein [Chitinophaga tropicalis]